MKILGIDPGLHRVGIAVADITAGRYQLIQCGVITTPSELSLSVRLVQLRDDLTAFIAQHPDIAVCGIEELFFSKNVTTAPMVYQARGVILELLERVGVQSVISVKPQHVKQYVTGSGSADKREVQEMVRHTFHLDAVPKPDDAADAAAIAIAAEAIFRSQGHQKNAS
mgnify:CR=1 FL=1